MGSESTSATPMQAAKYFGVAARTLRYWSAEKGGPRSTKGRYDLVALELWYSETFPDPQTKHLPSIFRTPEEKRRNAEEFCSEFLASVDEKGETLPKTCIHCGGILPPSSELPYLKKELKK